MNDLLGYLSHRDRTADREEAARNIADAAAAWIKEARQIGRAIPKPSAHLALAGE